MLRARSAKPKVRLATRIRFAARWHLGRVTRLTWLIWIALVADLCAPGYLIFHLGFTTVDVRSLLSEALEYSATSTDSIGDVRVTKTGEKTP